MITRATVLFTIATVSLPISASLFVASQTMQNTALFWVAIGFVISFIWSWDKAFNLAVQEINTRDNQERARVQQMQTLINELTEFRKDFKNKGNNRQDDDSAAKHE